MSNDNQKANQKIIATDQAPAAIGPYSQATGLCKLVFTAMQIALDPATGELVGDDQPSQVRQCLQNVEAILTGAGSCLAQSMKVTIFVTDMSAFGAINEVYVEFVGDEPPARAVIEVTSLPKGALVAVEAIGAHD